MRLLRRLAMAAMVAVGGAGCNQATAPAIEAPRLPDELSLGPGDVFEVRVFGEPDLSGLYRLAADGTIDYPLIGQIRLDGMDPHQAAEELAHRLRERFLRHPEVSILVREQSSKKVIVSGQVAKPGTYPFVSNMTVLEAVSVAGGFTPIASKHHVTVTRTEGGRKNSFEVDVQAVQEGKAKNVAVVPGDVIFAPERLF